MPNGGLYVGELQVSKKVATNLAAESSVFANSNQATEMPIGNKPGDASSTIR
jgi:hypothetical protein